MKDYTKLNSGAQTRVQATAAEVDQGLRSYMLKVYNTMAIGLAATGLVALLVVNTPALLQAIAGTPLYWIIALVELGFVIYFAARVHTMSESKAKAVFYAYAALNGLTFSVIFAAYTGESIARAFFITAAAFGAMSLYGYTTKRDLTGFGSFLFMGLIGLLIAMIVNIFLQSAALHFIASCAGVLIFTGLTAYDSQKIKEMYYMVPADRAGAMAIRGALSLYLDFINLMVMLLQFFGDRR